MKHFILAVMLMFALSTQAHAATRDEQRGEIQKMQKSVLSKLYKAKPAVKSEIKDAVGYAVFSSADVAAIFFSGSYGHGIAHDNRDGQETYMQMASAGVGLGIGAKDFRVVFVFHDHDIFRNFVKTGLDLSGHVDLAAKQGSKGGAVTDSGNVLKGVSIYQMTDTGLLAQIMLKGTKFWRDADLNEYDQTSSRRVPAGYNN